MTQQDEQQYYDYYMSELWEKESMERKRQGLFTDKESIKEKR